jgi:hypothetical protein
MLAVLLVLFTLLLLSPPEDGTITLCTNISFECSVLISFFDLEGYIRFMKD